MPPVPLAAAARNTTGASRVRCLRRTSRNAGDRRAERPLRPPPADVVEADGHKRQEDDEGGDGPLLNNVQRQLSKLEITKASELELSGGRSSCTSESSSDSSNYREPCSWKPRGLGEHCASCGHCTKAAAPGANPGASATGDVADTARAAVVSGLRLPRLPPRRHSTTSCPLRPGANTSDQPDTLLQPNKAGQLRKPAVDSSSSSCSTSSASSASSGAKQRSGGAAGPAGGAGCAFARGPLGSGPQAMPQAHPYRAYRQDIEHRGRSFSLDQMWRIERENQDLLRRLRACRPSGVAPPNAGSSIRRITASSAINRTARQRQIDHENRIIRRRLQDIQQSKSQVADGAARVRRGFGRP